MDTRTSINQPLYSELAISWIGLYCLAVSLGVGRFLFTATLPDILNQLNLSTQVAGWLASANYFGYFIGAIICMLVPKSVTWRWLFSGLILSIITTLALALPLNLFTWYVVRMSSGVASAIGMVLGTTYILSFFTHQRRYVLSTIHYSGIGLGIFLTALLTWFLFEQGAHYRLVWGVSGLLSLPLLYYIYRLRPQTKSQSPELEAEFEIENVPVASPDMPVEMNTPPLQSLHKITWRHLVSPAFIKSSWQDISAKQSKRITLVCVSYILAGFGYITSATFLPVMASNRLSHSQHSGLMVWIVVGLFTVLSNPIWGKVAQRYGADKVLIALLLLQAVGMLLPLLLVSALSGVGLYANAVILGLTFVGIVSMTLTILKDINPQYANLLVGLATLMYSIGQFLGPLITVSLARQSNDFSQGLMLAGLGLFIATILNILAIVRH